MDNIEVNPVWFDLSDVVKENYILFKQRADSKQITLTNLVTHPIQLFADKDMIKLVLRNFINNAIKFTQSGGQIDIGVECLQDRIIVFVLNMGIGMTEMQLSKIFNNDIVSLEGTAGEKGTGLGLTVCKEFIEKNGGTIGAVSTFGKGSKFYFDLKICKQE